MFTRSLWIPFGMSFDNFQLVTFARNDRVDHLRALRQRREIALVGERQQWWARPSAPVDSHADICWA